MATIHAWAAPAAKQAFVPFEYEPGPLGPEEIEVAVAHCGICHSDLSVLNNDWGISTYPYVGGHEAVGHVVAVGELARGVKVGQRVGIGWNAGSCMHCRSCLSGFQQLCTQAQPTIVGHHGGFASRLRSHWAWAIPVPDKLDLAAAGPLLCGGITVFDPFMNYGILPTQRVGIVGIGGLGHMAVKFAAAWGCEVTAFTSSESKKAEAQGFGAHHVVTTRDANALAKIAGSLDLLIVTVNVPLDWPAMMATLAPRGRMHVVGAVLEPIPVGAFDLIMGQRSISGSPTGSPVGIATMLDFAALHNVLPQVERFPMRQINEAMAHLEAGKARYRIVLDADFAC